MGLCSFLLLPNGLNDKKSLEAFFVLGSSERAIKLIKMSLQTCKARIEHNVVVSITILICLTVRNKSKLVVVGSA